jgi:hypothetical protein
MTRSSVSEKYLRAGVTTADQERHARMGALEKGENVVVYV